MRQESEKNAHRLRCVCVTRIKIFNYPDSILPQQPPHFLEEFGYIRNQKISGRCGSLFGDGRVMEEDKGSFRKQVKVVWMCVVENLIPDLIHLIIHTFHLSSSQT